MVDLPGAQPVHEDRRLHTEPTAPNASVAGGGRVPGLLMGIVVVLILINTAAAVGIWWTISQIHQTVQMQIPPIEIDAGDPS